MKTLKGLLIICFSFCLLTGCATRIIDFTVISTKNVDMSKSDKLEKGKRVKGKHSVPIILFFPIGAPNMKTAVDKTIEQNENAVALLDGVVYYKEFYIPLLFGQVSYVVEGTLLEQKN